jgi:hypothetical protein
MSKKGNAVLASQSTSAAASSGTASNLTSASLPKENNKHEEQNSASAKRKDVAMPPSAEGCKKCIQEQKTGEKNNLHHSAAFPKKKTAKRHNSGSSGNDYQYKKKAKPTEPIFVNKNPVRRTSLVGGGIDADLISSIHSTRHDLTGGSGLGVGGFEVSFARATSASDANSKRGVCISQTSSSERSSQKTSQAAARRRSRSNEFDVAEAAITKANKAASLAAEAVAGASRTNNEVIVLGDSDDECSFNRKPAAANRNEVIEID